MPVTRPFSSIRPSWLILSFTAGFLLAMGASELVLQWQDAELRVAAPRVHFLSGQPLERLHDGRTVPFDFQLLLFADRTRPLARSLERFDISYDLWEEKFSVSRLSVARRGGRKTVSHLTANAAEAWCLENLSIGTAGIAGDQPVWVRLEIRAGDGKETPPVFQGGDGGISLASLVEIFSRPSRKSQPSWMVESGPLRLADWKVLGTRGS